MMCFPDAIYTLQRYRFESQDTVRVSPPPSTEGFTQWFAKQEFIHEDGVTILWMAVKDAPPNSSHVIYPIQGGKAS